jgi:hypothetical protein
MLFINLNVSLELLYLKIFKLSENTAFIEVELSKQQKEHISVLSELTRKHSKAFLAKDKRELKMKTTFVKKIGDLLGSNLNLITNRPGMFMMIMRLLKAQKTLDYC